MGKPESVIRGWDAYGLRRARKHVAEMRKTFLLPREKSEYATGVRDTLKEMERLIAADLERITDG